MKSLRILYLAQFFEPEPMLKGASFVRGLIEAGHEVEVVTGFPNYPIGRLYDGHKMALLRREIVEGVTINRVPLFPSHGRSSTGRMLNYFSFIFSAIIYGIFFARKFDVIYSYPPPTVGIAATVIGMVRRRPFVLDIQDLWPDSVVKSGMAGTGRMGRILTVLCNFVYRNSSRIIAQSNGIAAKLVERGVPADKVDIIFNWADENAARALGKANLSAYAMAGKFNFVYGGNLGHMQGLDILVRATVEAARQEPRIHLLLIGNGAEQEALEKLVRDLGTDRVTIASGIPRDAIGDVFAAADVLAFHLLDDPLFEITIPQKTQFYLAMGRPILAGVRGEAAEFVLSAGAGVAVMPENIDAMAEAMVRLSRMDPGELELMGSRGRDAYHRHFSFGTAINATIRSLHSATQDRRSAHV